MNPEVLIKLTSQEVKMLIEILTRQPHEGELEAKLRADLRKIYLEVQDKIEKHKEKIKTMPTDEDVLRAANPTSAEHID
tara:strand:- start:181 stop:417 length:237 start_codon:yes stop_codon:yes gene_type:complete